MAVLPQPHIYISEHQQERPARHSEPGFIVIVQLSTYSQDESKGVVLCVRSCVCVCVCVCGGLLENKCI